MPLPATLQLDVNDHLHRRLYLNTGVQLGLIKSGTKVTANQYYNTVLLTPRYEGRALAFICRWPAMR